MPEYAYVSHTEGGADNYISGFYCTMGGGSWDFAVGQNSTVAGGHADTVRGMYGFATNYGSEVRVDDHGSAAFSGMTTTAASQLRCDQFQQGFGTTALDHPLDPNGKILIQYTVGSSEVMLIYRGVAYIGTNGRADVQLPDYFDALNKNPMI